MGSDSQQTNNRSTNHRCHFSGGRWRYTQRIVHRSDCYFGAQNGSEFGRVVVLAPLPAGWRSVAAVVSVRRVVASRGSIVGRRRSTAIPFHSTGEWSQGRREEESRAAGRCSRWPTLVGGRCVVCWWLAFRLALHTQYLLIQSRRAGWNGLLCGAGLRLCRARQAWRHGQRGGQKGVAVHARTSMPSADVIL